MSDALGYIFTFVLFGALGLLGIGWLLMLLLTRRERPEVSALKNKVEHLEKQIRLMERYLNIQRVEIDEYQARPKNNQ